MGTIVNEPTGPSPGPGPDPESGDPVVVQLVIPGDPSFLRLARLAAADFGTRAGFTLEEIDDLRIAVDELCSAVMGYDKVDESMTLTYRTSGATVEIEGVLLCPDSWGLPPQTDLSRAIVSAVCDDHRMELGDGARRFSLVKHGQQDG